MRESGIRSGGVAMAYGTSNLEKNFPEGGSERREGGRVFKDLR